MNDPLADKLVQFTPDTAGLDRDTLLFQAGRSSVHPARFWPIAAGVLLLAQATTVVLWCTREPDASPLSVPVRPVHHVIEAPQPAPAESPTEPRSFTYRRPILSGDLDDLPTARPTNQPVVNGSALGIYSYASVLDFK